MTGTLRSVDPATGDEVATYPSFTATEVDAALAFEAVTITGSDRQVRELTHLRTWWVSGSATPNPGAALTE